MTHAIATTSLSLSRMDSTTPATMSKNHDANEYVPRAAKYLRCNLIGFNGMKVCGSVVRAAKVKMLDERAPVAARVPAGVTARRSKPLSLGNRLTRSNNITCYFPCGTPGQVYPIRSLLINMASISMSCGNCPTVFGTRALNSKPIERKYSIAPIKSGVPSYSLLTANSV